MNNNYRILTFLLFIAVFYPQKQLEAQKYNWGITATPFVGFLLPHHTTIDHLLYHHAYGAEVGLSIQTNGKKQWHHDFHFPRINLLAFYGNFGNPKIIGYAFGVEGNIYLPYFKKKGWSFGNTLNAGIGYLTKRYDRFTNPKNNVIGSHVNCIVGLGFQLQKQWKHQSIGIEINLKHMSNGAYKLPNLGINIPSLGINYTYFLHPLQKYDTAIVPKEEMQPSKTWKFFTQLIGSTKQIYPTGGKHYGVIALGNYVHYKVKDKVILEGGIDVVYDGSTIASVENERNKAKNTSVGVYFAYVLPVHRLQLLVGMGGYLYNPINPAGRWYHRFGARFRIAKKLWANITIKSHWAKADYFEYGLAYQWN